jgi:hypothetical protein
MGTCTKSPNAAAPCVGVMQLGEWQDVGTSLVQDQKPLIKKSTIMCNYGGSTISIKKSGQINVPSVIDKVVPLIKESEDFDLEFSLDKNEDTIVPFGILDFNDEYENPHFRFKYKLSKADIDSLNFEIFDEKGKTIYQMRYLQTIVVEASKNPLIFNGITEIKKEKKESDKIIDFASIYLKYDLQEPDYTKKGTYYICWNGFDNNEIYDSSLFNGKKLKAKITATKDGKSKIKEIEFSTQYHQVSWVDVKINKNKNAKRIDITLRVDLKDGGAKGLSCWNNTRNFNPPHTKSEICDWDKIPQSDITRIGKPVIKTRTRSYADLEKLALEGLKYHWGRNAGHAVAKDVKINGESYEVYVNLINNTENAMDDLDLIFNTNGDWMRSGNPGSATLNPISWIGNLVSREAVCYNVGYIKGDKWSFRDENNEDIEFSETVAHEIGHEILKSYGGTIYSYGHKGSVNTVTQSSNDRATKYPVTGEIDIMPYYTDWLPYSQRNRIAAAEKDVISLIWLTKIKIE